MNQHKSTERIFITKANGAQEPFDEDKLRQSLLHSKASPDAVEKTIVHVLKEIQPNSTTAEVYKHAFFLLRKTEKKAALRYSLRRAIINLGPTGFPFEKYVAHIFRERGFTAETDQIVRGGCVDHEVDVVAWNDSKLIMTEAKFHHEIGVKTDLKVALYVKARFDDLKEATFFYGHRRSVDEMWLVTNTKFTTTAISYGMCKGLMMIGWNFPEKGNLQDMIEDSNLHPITCLGTLSSADMKSLIERGVVLCRELVSHRSLLEEIGLNEDAIAETMAEIEQFI